MHKTDLGMCMVQLNAVNYFHSRKTRSLVIGNLFRIFSYRQRSHSLLNRPMRDFRVLNFYVSLADAEPVLGVLFIEIDWIRWHSVLRVAQEEVSNHMAPPVSSFVDPDGSLAVSQVHIRYALGLIKRQLCPTISFILRNYSFRWKRNLPQYS